MNQMIRSAGILAVSAASFTSLACSSATPEPTGSTTSHLDERDADFICAASCDLASAAACAEGVEPACDTGIYCEGLCGALTSVQKTELVCIRTSAREEVCCQNYYGCQTIVDTSCKDGQPC